MIKNRKTIVVGIGELLWDMLPGGKRAGGAPINFVYHATQMGAEGYAISAVGKDDLGEEIIKELEKNHINNFIEKNDYPTGTVEVEINKGQPFYTIVEGVAWDYIPLTPKAIEVVKIADAVCYGTLALRNDASKKTVEALLKYAPQHAFRFFDVNLRGTFYSYELIDELLSYANIFKINDEEIVKIKEMFSLSGSDDEICMQLLERYNLKYLIFTAGENYSIIYSATEKSYLDTVKVEVVDTVGAGDAFSGAFIYSILTGKTLKEAHKKAVEIAAFVCTKPGAWPKYE